MSVSKNVPNYGQRSDFRIITDPPPPIERTCPIRHWTAVLVDSMEKSLVPNDMGVKQRPVFHYFTFILHQMAKQYVIRMSLKNTHGLFTRLMLFWCFKYQSFITLSYCPWHDLWVYIPWQVQSFIKVSLFHMYLDFLSGNS